MYRKSKTSRLLHRPLRFGRCGDIASRVIVYTKSTSQHSLTRNICKSYSEFPPSAKKTEYCSHPLRDSSYRIANTVYLRSASEIQLRLLSSRNHSNHSSMSNCDDNSNVKPGRLSPGSTINTGVIWHLSSIARMVLMLVVPAFNFLLISKLVMQLRLR